MSKIGKDVLYLLGYLTEDQWKDAFRTEHLNRATLKKYKEAVEDEFDIKIDLK